MIGAALAVSGGGLWATARGAPPIDPRWDAVSVRVPDLDCAFWCSVKLTTALDETVGMRAEAFDAKQRRVRIRFDPDRYAVDDVRAALRARGFRIDDDAAVDPRR